MSYDNRTCLTVHQPWATWIVEGWKDVENRTWSTNYRGRLWIHAGKTWDAGAFDWARQTFGKEADDHIKPESEYPRGAIIGHVELCQITTATDNPWWTGSFGWLLTEPVATEPEPKRGYQQLWIAGNAPPQKV